MVSSEILFPSASSCISEGSVLAALEAMRYGSYVQYCNPLEDLQLVEESAINSSLPASPFKRPYLLSQILISIITDELYKHRRAIGVPCDPSSETSCETALVAITRDVRTGRAELFGWNWLYYHYVRVDLDISPDIFCRVANITQRTLYRHRKLTVRRLVFSLIAREQESRRTVYKQRLYAQLPTMIRALVYGRDAELKRVKGWLSQIPRSPIQVVGEVGIGKTAFVHEVIRSLIDSETIEFLLWIDSPSSLHEIRQHFASFVQERGGRISIREFVLRRRTAVVIDGIEAVCDNLDGLKSLLDDLGLATVFLTSQVPIPMRILMRYVVLSELEHREANRFIHALLSNWHLSRSEPITDDDIQAIWQHTGGNPLSIEQAVYQFQMHQVCLESDFIKQAQFAAQYRSEIRNIRNNNL